MRVEDHNRIPEVMASLPQGIVHGLRELEDATLEQIDDGFERGEDAMGNNWQPLSPLTVELKRQKGVANPTKILVETSELRNSFEGDVDATSYALEVAVDDPKAQYHEFGAPDANIPKRAMVRPAAQWVEHEGMDEHFEPALERTVRESLLTVRGGV